MSLVYIVDELTRRARAYEAATGRRPTQVRVGPVDAKKIAAEAVHLIAKDPPSAAKIYHGMLKGKFEINGIKIFVDEHRVEDNFYFTPQR